MESLSHSRHPNRVPSKSFNGNGYVSFGGAKTMYDDVFGGAPKTGVPILSPRAEDYCEIFGIRASSIPVLDLPEVDEGEVYFDVRSSGFDYSDVFGGFDGSDFAVSYEDLFGQSMGANAADCSSDEAWTPETESFIGETYHLGDDPCFSIEDPYQFFEDSTKFNISYHKADQSTKEDLSNELRHTAQVQAVPGYMFLVDQTSPLPEAVSKSASLSVASDINDNTGGANHFRKVTSHSSHSSGRRETFGIDFGPQRDYVTDCSNSKGFVTISEISLQTKPSHLPPPARPPPSLDIRKVHSCVSIAQCTSSNSDETAGDSSPSFFDVEVDATSSAAVSAAAVKEAMKKAQAKMKSAKDLIERKNEGHLAKRSAEEKNGRGSLSSQGSDEVDDADEWKEATQFFELVRTDKHKKAVEQTNVEQFLEQHAEILLRGQTENRAAMETYKQEDENCKATESGWQNYELEQEELKVAEVTFDMEENNGRPKVARDKLRLKEHEKVNGVALSGKFESFDYVQLNLDIEFEQARKNKKIEHKLKEDGARRENENKCRDSLKTENREIKPPADEEALRQDEIKKKLKEATRRNEKKKLKEARERAENEKILIEALQQLENKKIVEEALEQEKKEKEAREWEERERRQRKACEREEDEKRLINAQAREENEKRLMFAREWEEAERRHRKAREIKENKKKLKEARTREENEKRLKEAHIREENEKKLKEAREWEENERRQREARKREENEKKLKEARDREENEKKLKLVRDREEIERRRQDEAREIEENVKRLKEEREKEENEKKLKKARECEEADRRRQREAREIEENVKRLQEALEREENEKKLKEARECEEADRRRQKEAREVEENVKRLKEALEREEHEKKLKEARDKEEIERIQRKAREIEENEKRLKEVLEREKNERFKEACEREENEKRLKEACERQENEKRLKEAHDRQENEKRLKEAHDREENEMRQKEACERDDTEKKQKKAYEREENEKRWREVLVQEGNARKQNEARKGDDIERRFKEGYRGKEVEKRVEDLSEQESCSRSLKNDSDRKEYEDSERKPVFEDGRQLEADKPAVYERRGNLYKIDKHVNRMQGTVRKDKDLNETHLFEEKEFEMIKRERELEQERLRKIEEEAERVREREKDRMAVDRATLEARESAREKVEKAAVERATAEARQRVLVDARERLEKACAEAREKSLPDKTSMEARLRAERDAVERATTEARERAAIGARERVERSFSDKFSGYARNGIRHSSSSSDLQDLHLQNVGSSIGSRNHNSSVSGASWYAGKCDGNEGESAERCRARLERHRRTAERAAKALAEKNMRDLLAQKEQTERTRLSETLDAEVKRWSSGKEGNLRALLSTLQYILGSDSGWQPIPLTEVITNAAVKKAYRKATLCVHPDKLQQRGANIHQKYICEKVFDLLKEAWNKFNSEER